MSGCFVILFFRNCLDDLTTIDIDEMGEKGDRSTFNIVTLRAD
jgi:hypothetical protein